MRLSCLADSFMGYTARGRLTLAATGPSAIQTGDIDDDGTIRKGSLSRYELPEPTERHLLQSGDLVFRSRGSPNVAAIVGPLSEPTIAILPLIVLRPDRERILPDYLAWAINHPRAQRQFNAQAQGTGTRMISKSALDAVEIPLPDLDTQARIVAVDRLAKIESRLLHDLADRRRQVTDHILAARAQAAGTLAQGHVT